MTKKMFDKVLSGYRVDYNPYNLIRRAYTNYRFTVNFE